MVSTPDTGTGADFDGIAASLLDIPAGDDTQPDSEQQAEAQQPDGGGAEATSEEAEGGEPTEAEAEGSEADQGAEDDSAGDTFTVKIDGTDVKVTRDELVRGYQRQADYTRKTQQVAELRKGFEAEMQALREERAQYRALLPQLAARLSETMGPEPDWDKLRQEDPVEFGAQWAEWQRRRERVQAVEAERQRLETQKAREADDQAKQRLQAEASALLDKVPEWKDPKIAEAERAKIRDYVSALGVSPDEMQHITDHRLVLALRDAARYRDLMAGKDAAMRKVQQAPNTLKPGRGTAPRQVADRTRQLQRLAKTGSIDDAAALILMG